MTLPDKNIEHETLVEQEAASADFRNTILEIYDRSKEEFYENFQNDLRLPIVMQDGRKAEICLLMEPVGDDRVVKEMNLVFSINNQAIPSEVYTVQPYGQVTKHVESPEVKVAKEVLIMNRDEDEQEPLPVDQEVEWQEIYANSQKLVKDAFNDKKNGSKVSAADLRTLSKAMRDASIDSHIRELLEQLESQPLPQPSGYEAMRTRV